MRLALGLAVMGVVAVYAIQLSSIIRHEAPGHYGIDPISLLWMGATKAVVVGIVLFSVGFLLAH